MKKILIIEDDPLLLRMYGMGFSEEDFEVILATEGSIGLIKAKEQSPDLILLDIMMPKPSGLDVLKKLKESPKLRDIPVIILTNLNDTSMASIALTMGAAKYVIKSENRPAAVEKIVREVLGQAESS